MRPLTPNQKSERSQGGEDDQDDDGDDDDEDALLEVGDAPKQAAEFPALSLCLQATVLIAEFLKILCFCGHLS